MSTQVQGVYRCKYCGELFELGATIALPVKLLRKASITAHLPKELPATMSHICSEDKRGVGELVGMRIIN